nr:sodium:hydrogen exchanger 2 (nhe2) [Hymenolepis microstoma]
MTLLQLIPFCLAQSTPPPPHDLRLIKLVNWKIEEFEPYLAFTGVLALIALFKLFYPKIPYIAEYIPQSLILVVSGIAIAAAVNASGISFEDSRMVLTPTLFFNFLLPPVVLDASYNLSNRTFLDYLASILIYAIFGTLINFFIIGPLMYGIAEAGAMGPGFPHIPISNYFLFSSLIVAVDPVAVLAIFQEIGVNLGLYFTVFGESLLNDAVTVVLYEIMREFSSATSASIKEVGYGIASFFTISLGGVLTGLIMGVISCLFTRWEAHLASILLILLALFSYYITNCLGWSGIIALICCGLIQSGYAFHNISAELVNTLEEIVRQVSEVSEALIFLLLGFQIMTTKLEWSTGFCLWAFFCCTLARGVSILAFSKIVNWLKINNMRIGYREQLIMIYGGLRGAVASSLAFLLKDLHEVDEDVKEIIITCTLFIIAITVGFQGLTVKPLVKLSQIKLQEKQTLSVINDLSCRIIDHTLAGVESIIGSIGRNRSRELFARMDFKFIRPILQRRPQRHNDTVLRTYEQISLSLHWATVKPEMSTRYLKDLPETLVNRFLRGDMAGGGSHRYKGRDEEDSLFDVITDEPPTRRESRSVFLRVNERPEWLRPTSMISERPGNPDKQYKERFLYVMRRKSSEFSQADMPDQAHLAQLRRLSHYTDMPSDTLSDTQ